MALANTRPLGKLMSLSRGPKLCTGTLAALAILESMWVIKALWERWRFSSVWTVHKSSKYDELLRASDWVVPGSAWIYLYCLHLAAVHGEAPLREFTFRFHCIIKQERDEPSKSRKKQEKHLPALHLNSNFPWSSPLSACTIIFMYFRYGYTWRHAHIYIYVYNNMILWYSTIYNSLLLYN